MHPRRARPRRAAAAVELAILSPFFVILLFGLWEVGRLVEVQKLVNNAVREGGRQASTGKYTAEEVEQVVRDYLEAAGLPIKDVDGNVNVVVTVTNVDTGGDVKDSEQMEHLRVTVSFPYANVRWLATNHFLAEGTLLTAAADWYAMTDVPITVSTTIPSAPLQ